MTSPVLAGGDPRFRDDDGSADPGAAAALAAFASAAGSEHAALTALARSRLLVPVVAAGGGEKDSEMSLPTLVGRDGRRAVPAFTCQDALARWRPQGRPVPVLAALVWRAAVDDACAVVVDIAGPVPLAIDGARLVALAEGRPVPLPHEDPDVLAAVRAAAAEHRAITGLRIAVGPGGDPAAAALGGGLTAADHTASDLQIQVTLAGGCAPAAGAEVIRLLGAALMAQLGGRLRRGIAISVTPPAGRRGS